MIPVRRIKSLSEVTFSFEIVKSLGVHPFGGEEFRPLGSQETKDDALVATINAIIPAGTARKLRNPRLNRVVTKLGRVRAWPILIMTLVPLPVHTVPNSRFKQLSQYQSGPTMTPWASNSR